MPAHPLLILVACAWPGLIGGGCAQIGVYAPNEVVEDTGPGQSAHESDPIAIPDPDIPVSQPRLGTPQSPVDGADPASNKDEVDTLVQELERLYRRLHVVLDDAARTELLIELLGSNRERLIVLGYELASRDLSSGRAVDPEVTNACASLMKSPSVRVRDGAVRLLTRLAPPNAMSLLNNAIRAEGDPMVAVSILRGLERWPSPESRDAILRWYAVPGEPHRAAASAAWACHEIGCWSDEAGRDALIESSRTINNEDLTIADLRLIAALGDTEELTRVTRIALDDSDPKQADAASALVESTIGVDTLIVLAKHDARFFGQAAGAITRHRANPNGFRQLASLPYGKETDRTGVLMNLTRRLRTSVLVDAVRGAIEDGSITEPLAIRLLQPLLSGAEHVNLDEVDGILYLARLELSQKRPDRAIETLSFLPLDGLSETVLGSSRTLTATARVMLGVFDEVENSVPAPWIEAFRLVEEPVLKARIARAILERAVEVNETDRAAIEQAAKADSALQGEEPTGDEPAPPAGSTSDANDG